MHNSNDNNPPPNTQPIGNRMITIAWVIVILLLTWLFGNWEEKQINPNQNVLSKTNNEFIEVVLHANRAGHYLVDGFINRRPVTFLLDTGATNVAVPGALASSLGLEPGQKRYSQTANGTAVGATTRINSLEIGEIKLYDLEGAILPGMQGEQILLGMNVLKRLEFAQKGKQLTLRQYR
ncbi:retropepsin-like aspartic protease family protein [Aliikangiella sp. IMCC44653]